MPISLRISVSLLAMLLMGSSTHHGQTTAGVLLIRSSPWVGKMDIDAHGRDQNF